MSLLTLAERAFSAAVALTPPQPLTHPQPLIHPQHAPPRTVAHNPTLPPPPEAAGTTTDDELAKLADAQADAAHAGETIEISGEAPPESASSVHLSAEQLRLRLRTQPSDVLRQIPGLVVSQHAGGGKSDQYFIRGFDSDHGTDIAVFSDGVPVNLTSHGHGQGYSDTHWMIPETIDTVDIHKGPYAARYGDFYTAGALELKTVDEVPDHGDATVWIAGSTPTGKASTQFDRFDRRIVGMASPHVRDGDKTLIAVQAAEVDGPFVNEQNYRQGSGLAKYKTRVGSGDLTFEATGYHGTWNQSGQVPSLEVDAGRLDRFGSVDPSEGGLATRASLSASYVVRDDDAHSVFRLMGYGVRNKLKLFSDFTLFARDRVHGDEIRQTDDRYMTGIDASYEKLVESDTVPTLLRFGVQGRYDDTETSLNHAEKRIILPECFDAGPNPCNHTDNRILDAAVYGEADIAPLKWLHVRPGLRVDGFYWNVADLDAKTQSDPMTTQGGTANRTMVGPKLSIEAHADEVMTFFVNGGSGFHSNDARAAVATNGHGSLARALGAEVGVRMVPRARARVSADLWYLHLQSEQVWSGDAGGTEPSDPTRRFGLDLEGSIDATPWLSLDANVTYAKSTIVANQGNGGALALAPRWMGSGGISVHDKLKFLSLRTRGIADRAGNDDASLIAKGYRIFDLVAGRHFGKLNVEVDIANLFDQEWREAQFAESSAVTPTAPIVEQMQYTPGMPLTATLKAAYTF